MDFLSVIKGNPHRADMGRYSSAKGAAIHAHPEGTLVRHKESGRLHLVQGHTDDGKVATTGGQYGKDELEGGLLAKSQPGVGDVHATTAIGNSKKRKAKDFLSTISDTKAKVITMDDVGKKSRPIEISSALRVTKVDDEQMAVFGWASVTHINGEVVIDKQGDIIESDELEKAVYDYVRHCREQGDMHERRDVGRLIESTVYTAEKAEKCGIMAFDPDTGEQLFGWMVGFKVSDPSVWKRIRQGSLPEFSIGGKAIRVPIDG